MPRNLQTCRVLQWFDRIPRGARRHKVSTMVQDGSRGPPTQVFTILTNVLSVLLVFNKNSTFNFYSTPPPGASFFKDVPRVLLVFVKNKQNAQDIRQKRGKMAKIETLTGMLKRAKRSRHRRKNYFFAVRPRGPRDAPITQK